MWLKLLPLCICCGALLTTVLAAVSLSSIPLDPDVEILPSASAISSQYVYRIHNKPIIGPVVAPTIEVDPASVAAPLNGLAVPAAHTNLPLAAPLPALRPSIVPLVQHAAPFVPLTASLSAPSIIPATSISHPTRIYGPPASPYALARLVRPLVISGRLRSRFSYRRRPSAITLRRYPTHSAYQWRS